jgi:hypothetical protein
MNTLGNFGGFVCAAAFGYIVEASGDYDVPVRCVALMVLIASGLFALVDCTRGFTEAAHAVDKADAPTSFGDHRDRELPAA